MITPVDLVVAVAVAFWFALPTNHNTPTLPARRAHSHVRRLTPPYDQDREVTE